MTGKVAVISGATRGLGRHLSKAFADAGFNIVGIFKSDVTAASALENELSSASRLCKTVQADITVGCNFLSEIGWIKEAPEVVLVNNAGPRFEPQPLTRISWQEYEDIFRASLAGAVHCVHAILPLMMLRGRGTVINVASSAATRPARGFSAYAAAKSALLAFTRALAVEYGERGLRVFSVSPGFMGSSSSPDDSDFDRAPSTESWPDRLKEAIAAGQGGALDCAYVAKRIISLVEDSSIPANGEDYVILPEIPASRY